MTAHHDVTISAEGAAAIEEHLESMIRSQRAKVNMMARRLVPNLTDDDILNPHDFPKVHGDPDFQFEDGILSGMIQTQISLRVRFRARSGGGD